MKGPRNRTAPLQSRLGNRGGGWERGAFPRVLATRGSSAVRSNAINSNAAGGSCGAASSAAGSSEAVVGSGAVIWRRSPELAARGAAAFARLAVLLLVAVPAWAQLQVSVLTPDGARPLNASLNLGDTAPLDPVDTLFEIRNTSSAAASLDTLTVSGTGFSMLSRPSQSLLEAGGAVQFGVRFSAAGSGGYSAVMKVNAVTYILRAAVIAAAAIKLDGAALASGSMVNFGDLRRGARVAKTFELANDAAETVSVRSIETQGAFAIEGLPPLPLSLKPGATARFDVYFVPTASRREDGVLTIDARPIRLTGTGVEPPLPAGRVVVTADARSGQQVKAAVRFDGASEGNGKGVLEIGFTPASGLGDDPAVMFTANSSRSLRFNVTEGDVAGPEAVFQTGTTAGTITLTLRLGEYARSMDIALAGAPVGIDSVKASRGASTITARVAGFDNTRSAAEMQFTFYDRNGTAIGGPIAASAAAGFKTYFQSAPLGGVFQLSAVFPVAGDIAQIDSMEIAMTNSAGQSRSQRVRLD